MPALPILSICVPSRNRQVYFQETIRALLASPREDVEFVFCDNSDQTSTMNDFIRPYLSDPRIVYIPAGERVRPMVENWEVAMSATTGRFITFIGDDDYVDPELAGLISRIEAVAPDVEAIDWSKLQFTWPYPGKPPLSNPLQLSSAVHEVPRALLMARAFQWQDARDVLGCGFGIYHGAVARPLMERLKVLGKGRYFEHPVVDYDNTFKVIMHGRRFIDCRRPLSVLGVCPLSNTASSRDRQKFERAIDIFDRELPQPLSAMDCHRDFPFDARLGVVASIGMTHHWFSSEHGHDFSGFESNFAKSAAIQCSKSRDQDEYDRLVADYRRAFSLWHGGRYLADFNPEFRPAAQKAQFSGLLGDVLYIADQDLPCQTPKDYYDFAAAMIEPLSRIEVDVGRYRAVYRSPAQQLATA